MKTNAQLSLIETPRSWKLDQHTREVGREGVARARAALKAGLRPEPARSGSPPRHPPGQRTSAAHRRHHGRRAA